MPLLRVSPAVALCLLLSGCLLQQMLRAGQPETWCPVQALLEQTKYPEASAELQPALGRQHTAELTLPAGSG